MTATESNSYTNIVLKFILNALKNGTLDTHLLQIPPEYVDIIQKIAQSADETAKIKARVVHNSYGAVNSIDRQVFLSNVEKSPEWMHEMLIALYNGADNDTIYKMVIDYMLKEL